MATKIIAENILQPEHFISATEQAGGYIGQPIPDSANAGDFTLLSSGNIADTVYSGTATGDGAGGGTTVVDVLLAAYGDDFWIGATIEITSGAYDGETSTITDFAQATGTLTFAALSGQIVTGVTFTLTLSYASREFEVELISSGDAGSATFKWSHDGGNTDFGRDNPDQAAWLNKRVISSIAGYDDVAYPNWHEIAFKIFRFADNEYVAISSVYLNIDHRIGIWRSTDGIHWTEPTYADATTWFDFQSVATTKTLFDAFLASSGRLYVLSWLGMSYSDDHGLTWTHFGAAAVGEIWGHTVIEPSPGRFLCTDHVLAGVRIYFTTDLRTCPWYTSIAGSETGYQNYGHSVVSANGDIVTVYESEEDDGSNYEIKAKISTDGGVTYGAVIAVMNFATYEVTAPSVAVDINGDIYVAAIRNGSIVFAKSIDNGATWAAEKTLYTVAGGETVANVTLQQVTVAGGPKMYCSWTNIVAGSAPYALMLLERGQWEAYSANACPVPVNNATVLLNNVVSLNWLGGGGIAGDKWTFTPQYSWAMSNIISGSPSKPFRTTTDSIDCAIVIDLGQYNRHRATGIGLLGCNVRTLKFQMNATDAWTSPSVDETISFDVATGTVDAVSGNMVQDTSFLASYKDHHFSNKGKPERFFFRATSGIDDDETWEILDNVDGWFILNTEAAQSMAASDTFAVFTSSMSDTFTGGNYRFLRILIETQTTADGFYQIGSMVAGMAEDLTKSWRVGFGKNHAYNIELMSTPAGGLVPIKKSNRRRVFTVRWDADTDTRQEVVAMADTMEGRSLCLIPNSSAMGDCYLVKFSGDINHTHRFSTDRFDITVTFQEVI